MTEIFWALAPEYAQAALELMNREPPERAEVKQAKPLCERISRKAGAVTVIEIAGTIGRETRLSWFDDSIWILGQDAIGEALDAAMRDPGCQAILLSFNSPGGIVAGAKELADHIAQCARKKRIAAYADGLCASAAFWLAAATGRIFAPATAQVGSIGVIMTLTDCSGFWQKSGIRLHHIAAGKFKAAGSADKELTEEEREYFQERLNQIHAIFKGDVAGFLKITAPESQWAEGQILVAAHAPQLVAQIVSDKNAARAILEGEIMPDPITLERLRAEAPELLAQIEAEAKSQVPGNDLALAAFRAVCSEEQYAAGTELYQKAAALKLTPEQFAGMAQALKAAQAEPRAAQFPAGHPAPLNAAADKPGISPLLADARRRGGV